MKKVALRTDDNRFRDLPGYPFDPHYLFVEHPDYQALRLHYVQTGKIDGNASSTPVVLLLHGCPSWSYLYRKVITTLQNGTTGVRIIAPDFIGCGKSDKLLARADYSYDFHVATLKQFIQQLDLYNIMLVCQDWGGPIGLRVASEMPERFTHILATNTLLPNCEPAPRGIDNWPGPIIENWVRYTKQADDIVISQVMQGVSKTTMPPEILAAYDAPFPDARYKQGMLGWPSLIPLTENAPGIRENRKAWEFLENSTIPFYTAFSDSDPSTAAWENVFQTRVKGAQDTAHFKISDAAHMVQEDKGEELAGIIKKILAS